MAGGGRGAGQDELGHRRRLEAGLEAGTPGAVLAVSGAAGDRESPVAAVDAGADLGLLEVQVLGQHDPLDVADVLAGLPTAGGIERAQVVDAGGVEVPAGGHLPGAGVDEVGELMPAITERLAAVPVPGDPEDIARLGLGRLEVVAQELDLVVEGGAELVRGLGGGGRDVALDRLLGGRLAVGRALDTAGAEEGGDDREGSCSHGGEPSVKANGGGSSCGPYAAACAWPCACASYPATGSRWSGRSAGRR